MVARCMLRLLVIEHRLTSVRLLSMSWLKTLILILQPHASFEEITDRTVQVELTRQFPPIGALFVVKDLFDAPRHLWVQAPRRAVAVP